MIYKIVLTIVTISVFFEIVESLFPIKNMRGIVASFSKIIMLYIVCKVLFDAI